jgi:hypothetical protein
MKISFCQTYGSDRKQLLEIKNRDKKLIEFLKEFDINIYSFHNCPEDLITWFLSNNNIPNIKIFKNNNITYTACINRLLQTLHYLGAKHFFFYQDDTFSCDNENIDMKELANFIFNEKDIILTLFSDADVHPQAPIHTKLSTLNIHNTTTADFIKCNHWSFDDSPYVCSTNYLSTIYDQNYLTYPDIWSAEHYLNSKFKQTTIKRLTTDKNIFRNHNFLGPNNWNKETELKILTDKKLL